MSRWLTTARELRDRGGAADRIIRGERMKMSVGFRYVLEYLDPVSGWSLRMSSDDEAMLLKIWADFPPKLWRVRDRSTDTVISQAST